jgi:hypothetical protein
MPKHKDIQKTLEGLKFKIIHDYEVPFTAKELLQNYKRDPYFGTIYKYLTAAWMPQEINTEKKKQQLIKEAEQYVIVNELLFRIHTENEQLPLQLCIPQSHLMTLLYCYHDHPLAGHQGIIRMYQTIRQKYYVPYLYDNLVSYARCCYKCQVRRPGPPNPDATFARIPHDYRPMSEISIDIKHMPTDDRGNKYLLLVCCDHTGFTIGASMPKCTSAYIAEALLNKVIYYFGPPDTIISDQDSAMTSSTMRELYRALQVEIKIVSPGNHGSLKVERQIKTIGEMICKKLDNEGTSWTKFVATTCYAYNTFVSKATMYSPFELVFARQPRYLDDVDFRLYNLGDQTAKDYMAELQKRFEQLKEVVVSHRVEQQKAQQIRERRTHLDAHTYAKGDLVYYYAPRLSELQTNYKKFQASWVGPLQIMHIWDSTHFVLADLTGKILRALGGVHRNLLKPFVFTYKVEGNRVQTGTTIDQALQHPSYCPRLATVVNKEHALNYLDEAAVPLF